MTLIQYLITDTEWTKNLHVIAYSPSIVTAAEKDNKTTG